jgi:hypothetical protein
MWSSIFEIISGLLMVAAVTTKDMGMYQAAIITALWAIVEAVREK